jgi:hypothetical protein
MAGVGNFVHVWRDGPWRRVELGGAVDADLVVDSITRSVDMELEDPSDGAILDFSAIESVDLDDEEIFRLMTMIRRRFRPGAGYRAAVVASADFLVNVVGDFVRVRDLLAGGSDAEVATVALFSTVDEAKVWLEEGG